MQASHHRSSVRSMSFPMDCITLDCGLWDCITMDCGKQCKLQAAGTKPSFDVGDLISTLIGNYILLIEWMDITLTNSLKALSSIFALNMSLYYSHESITQYTNINISCGHSPALWSKLPPSSDLSQPTWEIPPPTSKYQTHPHPPPPPTRTT